MSLGLKFAIFVLLNLVLNFSSLVDGEELVPCYFVFGGSYFDNGNNDKLQTTIKANYLPYGIDYSNPNGRFTNALNIDDFIAIALGFSTFTPPFVDILKGPEITKGVNYASASGGIFFDTGKHGGERFGMDTQLNNHELVTEIFKEAIKNNQTVMEHLGKCLYTVSLGDNDYIYNYFLPQFYRSSRFSPEVFAEDLIGSLTVQLRRLVYKYGAKKIAIFKIPPLGLSPHMVINHGSSLKVDNAIKIFNNKLNGLVDSLNQNIMTAKFTTINTYDIILSLYPAFKEAVVPCCKTIKETGLCVPQSTPCTNRSANIWFDGIHLCETAYFKIAERSMNNQSSSDVYPFDITHLIKST